LHLRATWARYVWKSIEDDLITTSAVKCALKSSGRQLNRAIDISGTFETETASTRQSIFHRQAEHQTTKARFCLLRFGGKSIWVLRRETHCLSKNSVQIFKQLSK